MKLLFEIFSEEIPSRMQEDGLNGLKNKLNEELNTFYGQSFTIEGYVTPRRIILSINDIPEYTKAVEESIRGPRTSAPEAALHGFLTKYNIASKEALNIDGDYYYYQNKKPAQASKDAIKTILENLLTNFTWPKSMKWGASATKWVRPIRSLLALLDNIVILVEFGNITASNITFGHRFLSPEPIKISNPTEYFEKIKSAYVILDPTERKNIIISEISKLTNDKNLQLIQDNDLLEEIIGLVEFPVVMLGEINSKFMHLPKEVLIITLKHHQKYLMLEDKNNNLAPFYIIVSNIIAPDNGVEIKNGNAKVLNARLSDAEFFFKDDIKNKLENNFSMLEKISFHEKFGSLVTKLNSVKNVAQNICRELKCEAEKVNRAIDLAKCDLVSKMVKEFPELQGIMGYYYAKNQEEPEEIALAIKEHYKPQGPSDYVPTQLISVIVALADKLDTLNIMFSLGIKPTGSKDPFALRRAAIGINRIIQQNKLDLDINKLNLRTDVIDFIKDKQTSIQN
jgi:glycyl-tRNA synthetase beta chain